MNSGYILLRHCCIKMPTFIEVTELDDEVTIELMMNCVWGSLHSLWASYIDSCISGATQELCDIRPEMWPTCSSRKSRHLEVWGLKGSSWRSSDAALRAVELFFFLVWWSESIWPTYFYWSLMELWGGDRQRAASGSRWRRGRLTQWKGFKHTHGHGCMSMKALRCVHALI